MKLHLQVFKCLSERLKPFSFTKRSTSWWQRKHNLIWQRIHIHKFTFANSFRVHSTIHVAGVEDEAVSLTGMHSNDGWFVRRRMGIPVRRYNFNFTDSTQSVTECGAELGDYIEECVIPWFDEWADEEVLVSNRKSPLHEPQKRFLSELKLHNSAMPT